MTDIRLSARETRGELTALVGPTLAALLVERAERKYRGRLDLDRRDLLREGTLAVLDDDARGAAVTIQTASTPLEGQIAYLASRVRCGSLTKAQVANDTGTLASESACYVMRERGDLCGGRASEIASSRREEAESVRLTLAASNPRAEEWRALVSKTAAERGIRRPTPSSPEPERAVWVALLNDLVRRFPALAAAGMGRSAGEFVNVAGAGKPQIVLDRLGKLEKTPPAA